MSALGQCRRRIRRPPHEFDAIGVTHGLGTRDHGALRIDLPPHGDAHVCRRPTHRSRRRSRDASSRSRPCRDRRFPAPACARIRGAASGKPKPLLITETFLCVLRRKAATDADASEASVVNTKRAASAISAGWINGLRDPRNMRPEYAAHGRKLGPRQAFEHARVIPEFELDDVGLRAPGRQRAQDCPPSTPARRPLSIMST